LLGEPIARPTSKRWNSYSLADENNALQWPHSSVVEDQMVRALELITEVLIALLAEAQKRKRAPREKPPPPAND
jgi:hypothetical protein